MRVAALVLPILATVALVAGACGPLAPASSATPPAPVTRIVRYVPVAPDASTSRDGSCFARSAAAPWRGDAWRCSSGNAISDPCFALEARTLVCGSDPSTGAKGFLLAVPEAPAASAPVATPTAPIRAAWMVELKDGTVCAYMTGATGGIDGVRANYGCRDRRWIVGELTPGDPWTADVVTISVGPEGWHADTRATVDIATVWQ